MNLTQTLNNTAGRFTTLIVNKGSTNNTFCAQITSATDKTVRFYDVNADANRVVPTASVVYARSGKMQYRKPRK
jgi:hypothetical protein